MAVTRDQTTVFLALLAACVIVGIAAWRIVRGRRVRRLLHSRWGDPADRKYTASELLAIRGQAAVLAGEHGFAVDDITWSDLDMDRLYTRVNTTFTDAGDHTLYGLLRNPASTDEALKRRSRFMAWAKNNSDGRERLMKILYGLGRTGKVDLNAVFAGNLYSRGRLAGCIALCAGLVLGIVLSALGIGVALIPTLLIAIANLVIALRSSALIGSYINAAELMPSVLLTARRIENLAIPELDAANNRIHELLGRVKGVMGNSLMAYYYSFNDPTNGLFYVKLFFLAELIGYYRLARSIGRYKAEILEAFQIVGEVDALMAAASWRETLQSWCEPELDASAGRHISFEELVHPLLAEPVANSLEIGGNILLTGSNATGKSTFLKTVAMNAILAQSLHTCTARRWEGGYFRVYTSMALRDDLFSHESYFITEIKSLKRMLDSVGGEVPCLCVVDEVLRGTNTGERIAAASEALRQFAGGNCLCLAATHDIELTYILEGAFQNMHFTETVRDGAISFDYKLRPGRSQSRNAIKLLELLGYGEGLVEAATKRLEHFERTGRWQEGGHGGI